MSSLLTGRIFDIQRGSLVDGPGVRTTVFFKMCNLRCRWCHNPESWLYDKQLLFDGGKCTACGRCIGACAHHAISVPDSSGSQTNRDICMACAACAHACPAGARTVCGRDYSIDEIVDMIRKDRPFYQDSAGGVTFSGGECMLQIDFLAALCHVCKQHDIHVAVDTAGHVPWGSFEAILDSTDLFLYDVKTMDRERHRAFTSVTNDLILDNLKRLDECGKEIIVSVPVINGFNNTKANIGAILAFAKPLRHIRQIRLLPYHKLGLNKYQSLDCRPPEGAFDVTDEEMAELNTLVSEFACNRNV